jgi:hypothetical protein
MSEYAIRLPGLTPDNLLAFMALLGALRALDQVRPNWRARARWTGPPFVPVLETASAVSKEGLAQAVDEGISAIAANYVLAAPGSKQSARDVKFSREEFRALVLWRRSNLIGAELVSAIAAELPLLNGNVRPSQFVHLAGKQHFLERLVDVPLQLMPPQSNRGRMPPERGPTKIAEALYQSWAHSDKSDSFRWDPADNQRYALRFGDPGPEGAAKTVHGANRLAAIGLLSFPCAAHDTRCLTVGGKQREGQRAYVWPIWTEALRLAGIEILLSQDLAKLNTSERRALGVAAVMRALRTTTDYYGNVTWATEVASAIP